MQNQNPRVGVGVMFLRNNQILLGKRHADPAFADSELHGEGTWTMPGGKVEFGESLEEAAVREVAEETGLTIKIEGLKLVSVADDFVEDAHFVTLGFQATCIEGEPRVMEPDEITEWQWFDLDNLPTPIFFPSKRILENYKKHIIYR